MTRNDILLSTKEAAQYIGLQAATLRNARSLGRLAGVEPPAYRKIGSVVRYEKDALDEWLAQFEVRTMTLAASSGKVS